MRHYSSYHIWIEKKQFSDHFYYLGLCKGAALQMSEIIQIYFERSALSNFSNQNSVQGSITELKQGALLAVAESTKSAIDILAPCPLAVRLFNEQLQLNPQLLFTNYQETWLAEVFITNDTIARDFMTHQHYLKTC